MSVLGRDDILKTALAEMLCIVLHHGGCPWEETSESSGADSDRGNNVIPEACMNQRS